MNALQVVAAFVLAGLIFSLPEESGHIKFIQRSTDSETTEPAICSRSTPCGWETYVPILRTILDYIKSPCECTEGMHCIRASDDISVSAYVHRCRPESETEFAV